MTDDIPRAPRGPAAGPRPHAPGWLHILGGLTALSSCATSASFRDQVYREGSISYRVGKLPPAWRRVQVDAGQLAFHHSSGGSIVAHGTCEGVPDAPLDVLTNHLLLGIERKRDLTRTEVTLDDRVALRTRIDGVFDGVPVSLDLVVLRKDGCLYDLHLVAGPDTLPGRAADFDMFVAGFAAGKGE